MPDLTFLEIKGTYDFIISLETIGSSKNSWPFAGIQTCNLLALDRWFNFLSNCISFEYLQHLRGTYFYISLPDGSVLMGSFPPIKTHLNNWPGLLGQPSLNCEPANALVSKDGWCSADNITPLVLIDL